MKFSIVTLLLLTTFVSCKEAEKAGSKMKDEKTDPSTVSIQDPRRVLDSVQIINDLKFLSSRECEGRRPGTKGHQLALDLVLQRMRATGVDSLGGSIIHNFTGRSLKGYTEGRNVVGLVKGKKHPEKYIVLTAHYDHLGLRGDTAWYAGADDNASGTAAVLGIAKYIAKNQPDHSIIIALLDREESGLEGAYALVPHLKQLLGETSVIFNLNLDMVARSDKNELYVCGVRYKPEMADWVKEVQAKTTVKLPMGHDGGTGKPSDDWTSQSDHAAFHKAGIPFIYLGVEDHPDYHKTSDQFEKVNPTAYIENCYAVLMLLKTIDERVSSK